MPSRSSEKSLFWAVVIVAVIILLSINVWQKTDELVEQNEQQRQQKADTTMIHFASGITAAEVKTAAYQLDGDHNPFQLPTTYAAPSRDPAISSPDTYSHQRASSKDNHSENDTQPLLKDKTTQSTFQRKFRLANKSKRPNAQIQFEEPVEIELETPSLLLAEPYSILKSESPVPAPIEITPVGNHVKANRPRVDFQTTENDTPTTSDGILSDELIEIADTLEPLKPTPSIELPAPVESVDQVESPAPASPFRQVSSIKKRDIVGPIKRYSEIRPVQKRGWQPIAELSFQVWAPKAAWPKPFQLVEELEQLEKETATQAWARETLQLVKLLHWTDTLDDSEVPQLLGRFSSKLQELNEITINISEVTVYDAAYAQGELANRLRKLNYDIARRIVLWSNVHNLAINAQSDIINTPDEQLQQMIQVASSRLLTPSVGDQWSQYLALDELSAAFNSLNPDEAQQRSAARQTLSRYYSTALKENHYTFLNQAIGPELVSLLRAKATNSIDLTELLKVAEYHEARTSGRSAAKMNDLYQSLLWSSDPDTQQVAGHIEAHYRNANFRVSVSDRFLNRLVPQTPEVDQPIQENVLGAQIQGNSRISNRLLIRLIPDNRQINLQLESDGRVRSLTQARRSGFTIHNSGNSRFRVMKRLALNRSGVQTEYSQAFSQTDSQLIGLQSQLDRVPIVGWFARKVAQDKIAESKPLTEQMTNQKIETEARQKIDTEVETGLHKVQDYLFVNLLQPLIAMEVEPTPVEMKTTDRRIVMRYRLAGRDQMAAHTARPRALANSLMSFQIHESAINNLIDRIQIKDREFTAVELIDHMQQVFQLPPRVEKKEIKHEARLVFGKYDPMSLRFVDQKFEISFQLAKLQIGKGKTWKNITVRSRYTPVVNGTALTLIQDDSGISLKGSKLKLRDQIAVRAVFTGLFEKQYDLNIVPKRLGEQFNSQNLTITQMVINNGWIGFSLDDAQLIQPVQQSSTVPVYHLR